MTRPVSRLALFTLLAASFSSPGSYAYAQGATTQTLAGTVVDASGAISSRKRPSFRLRERSEIASASRTAGD